MRVIEGLTNLGEGTTRESDLFLKTQMNFAKIQYILELKELGHSKKELIERYNFTPEEYRKYKGKSLEQIRQELGRGEAQTRNQFVG